MANLGELALYSGREQAFVKHELLAAYLEKFMMILGQHCPRVLYVDCFSGPWESSTTDYRDTSFGHAIQIIKGCQRTLENDFGRATEFRALFIEKDPLAFAKLKLHADKESSGRVQFTAWQGEFQNKVIEICAWIGTDFSFVLIDPKGYKEVIAPSKLAPLLKKRNVEALINYMWQFLSLAVGHLEKEAHRKNLEDVFGDAVCNAPKAGSPDRESWLLNLYKDRIVQASAPTGNYRTRTVSFPVEYPGTESVKYFLIHVTHSDMGVIKFAETSESVAKTQKSVRFFVRQQKKEDKTGVGDLFLLEGLQDATDCRELIQPWIDLLPNLGQEVEVDEGVMAQLIERYSCFESELQKGLMVLIHEGRIENLDMRRMRPKNGVLYKKRERLKRIK